MHLYLQCICAIILRHQVRQSMNVIFAPADNIKYRCQRIKNEIAGYNLCKEVRFCLPGISSNYEFHWITHQESYRIIRKLI